MGPGKACNGVYASGGGAGERRDTGITPGEVCDGIPVCSVGGIKERHGGKGTRALSRAGHYGAK